MDWLLEISLVGRFRSSGAANWFAITTQYGREVRTNRLLENKSASLYTLDSTAPHAVILLPSLLEYTLEYATSCKTQTPV
jgi:hypothetical protein